MADIIRFDDDPHRATQKVLPWYALGTLEAEETAAVEAHLQACAACRQALETERALGALIAAVPSEVERGWAAMRDRLGDRAAPSRRTGGVRRSPSRAGWTSFLPPLGWAITAQAASLGLIAGAAWIWASQPHPQYHTLSAPAAASTPGNVVVVFKPTASEQAMRSALRLAGARVVDGPTASDAYVLHVADAQRTAALGKLRADAQVMLAEPIDGEVRP